MCSPQLASPRSLEPGPARSRLVPVALDVTDPEAARSTVDDALRIAGRLDVLVNNAGVGLAGPFGSNPCRGDRETLSNELLWFDPDDPGGPPRLSQAETGSHRECFVGSRKVWGSFPRPIARVSSPLKGLSESLYYELLPFNIRIKLIEPGGIKTSFMQKFSQHDAYQPNLRSVETRMDQASGPGSTLSGPQSVADVIFKASVDGTERMRYPGENPGARPSSSEYFLIANESDHR